MYKLDYQFREIIIFHAKNNLKGKKLLEIGGVLPNQLLFDDLGVSKYINIESPDYIDAESGESYSSKYQPHKDKETIYCNAEEVENYIEDESIDSIFSVACFEHIYDLPEALKCCHKCLKNNVPNPQSETGHTTVDTSRYPLTPRPTVRV